MLWSYRPGSRERVIDIDASVLAVDYDENGPSFTVISGPPVDEDTLDELRHDMELADASQYIPVRPRFMRRVA